MAAKKNDDTEIYVATESGSAEVDGENVTLVAGVTRIRKGHAILKQLPNFFAPVEEKTHYDVERATDAPGEKRVR